MAENAEESLVGKTVAVFNTVQSDYTMYPMKDNPFKNLVQLGQEDMDFLFEPYVIVPRLAELRQWYVEPTKNTNVYFHDTDPAVSILTRLHDSMVIGDGIKVKVFTDKTGREENTEYTEILDNWLRSPSGASGDNRGKTIDNWVIPHLLRDCRTTGGSAWYKFIGYNPVSPEEEVGKLMMKWMDPRSYTRVHHEYYDWVKLMQWQRIQHDLPQTREEFDKWAPARHWWEGNFSGSGLIQDRGWVHIPSDKYYYFNIYQNATFNTILQLIVSKYKLRFLQDVFVEKGTFPFFIVKVPRNYVRDADDAKFQEKLRNISKLVARFRAGDCFAIEGEEYNVGIDGQKLVLSDGWEIEPVVISDKSINFAEMFRQLDEQIGYGLGVPMASITNMGVQGRSSSLSTGGQIGANVGIIVKRDRLCIADTFRFIFQDVLYEATGVKVDLNFINIAFSKIREEDAAQFLNTLISYQGAGALTTNELRMYGNRIGLDLEPLPPEMTPEGRMMLGLDEMLAEEPPIPTSFLQIKNPMTEMEKVRDEIDKAAMKPAGGNQARNSE
jgi:hypothetical protein